MPQVQLPLFPEGVTHINANFAFVKEDDRITYFNGNMPVFAHDSDDHRTFKMITAPVLRRWEYQAGRDIARIRYSGDQR